MVLLTITIKKLKLPVRLIAQSVYYIIHGLVGILFNKPILDYMLQRFTTFILHI